jgi:hypothetical protein
MRKLALVVGAGVALGLVVEELFLVQRHGASAPIVQVTDEAEPEPATRPAASAKPASAAAPIARAMQPWEYTPDNTPPLPPTITPAWKLHPPRPDPSAPPPVPPVAPPDPRRTTPPRQNPGGFNGSLPQRWVTGRRMDPPVRR